MIRKRPRVDALVHRLLLIVRVVNTSSLPLTSSPTFPVTPPRFSYVMGTYLTQVTTRCRIGGNGRLSSNLAEFETRFAGEQACREYLCQLRWPEGFRCPRCGHAKAWAVRTVLLECAGCGHQASATAGTIFQDTRKPLQSWFRAMWWLTSQKNGRAHWDCSGCWAWAATRLPDLVAQAPARHGAARTRSTPRRVELTRPT